MIWFMTICMSIFFYGNGFVIQDTFNVLLKDDADYKVDLVITDDDYEMVDPKEVKEFEIENEERIFKKLNEMARMAHYANSKALSKSEKQPYEEAIMPIIVVNNESNSVMATFTGPLPTTIRTDIKKDTKKENDTEYDYDNLVNEYYDEAIDESRSNHAYHIRKSGIEINDYGAFSSLKKIFTMTNCSEVQGIGLLAVKCLVVDFKDKRESSRDLMVRLWRIFQIWFLVYLGVAIPLWCTRGWCCCCLCCKFFKPRQTIDEAKKYVIAYPPGVFKNKSGEIRYDGSEREKQCYEEFEHFIKTL